jgi:hypothetical protein
MRSDFKDLNAMLGAFRSQLASGRGITRAQAAATQRFVNCFLKFVHHHHHNEDGEFDAGGSCSSGGSRMSTSNQPPSTNCQDWPALPQKSAVPYILCMPACLPPAALPCRRHCHALPGHPHQD